MSLLFVDKGDFRLNKLTLFMDLVAANCMCSVSGQYLVVDV